MKLVTSTGSSQHSLRLESSGCLSVVIIVCIYGMKKVDGIQGQHFTHSSLETEPVV